MANATRADKARLLNSMREDFTATLWANAVLDPDNKAPRYRMLRNKELRRRYAKTLKAIADRCYDAICDMEGLGYDNCDGNVKGS